ncbi:MAG: Branched-chain-amino-acid aminotransferase [Calditrichaeota bacterium]|nr:Branched-chain-amino-acid aminotransferase [Calditrichota bacterium]
MGFDGNGRIWMNGELVDWNDATIHVGAHVIHYGTSVFEGIRMYHRESTDGKSAIFRLRDHIQRLYNSAKMYRMTPDEMPLRERNVKDDRLKYSIEEIERACIETLQANGDRDAYIRPVVFRGYAGLGVDPRPCPVDLVILTWRWGKYLGEGALEQGVDVCVSNWNRFAPNTLPALAKTGANYMNSQLIKMDALENGYVEGIALNTDGYVSEGSGENLFVAFHGKGRGGKDQLITPPLGASVLPGITRHTILTLCEEVLGMEVHEAMIPREMLYIADEVFFTGTASEVTPIRSIDQIRIGSGKRGPIAERLQDEFFAIIDGEKADKHGWLTFADLD